ncbi:MAG: N-formylglutamate amidohydrolase [Acidimicrobiales bacterium]
MPLDRRTPTDAGVSDGDVVPAWVVESIGGASPLIIHVPHSATWIPTAERQAILLDDEGLDAELALMTDWHTDRLAHDALDAAGVPATVFVNRASRLLIDPERFPNDTEVMAKVGMGAVYTATSQRQPLRHPDAEAEEILLDRWFHPYAAAFTAVVDDTLGRWGRAVIIDLHSYPSVALPYERDHDAARPGVCLGTDPLHTPAALIDAAREAFDGVTGGVALNTPFAGTYVPLTSYEKNPLVTSMMVEVRRDLYIEEPGGAITAGWDDLAVRLANLMAVIAGAGVSHGATNS